MRCCKAIQKLEEQNTIEIFKEEDDEMYQLFREINDGQGFENDELYQLFEAEEIDFEGHFFVGICVGIRPDLAADMIKDSFERFNLLRFSIYNQIAQKLRGKAFVPAAKTTVHCISWECSPVERKILSWKPT